MNHTKRNIAQIALLAFLLASCGTPSSSSNPESSSSNGSSIQESASSEDVLSSVDSLVSSSEVDTNLAITGKGIDIQINGLLIKGQSRSVYVTYQNESYRGQEVVFEVDDPEVAEINDLEELMSPSGYDYSFMPEALVKGLSRGRVGIHVYLKNKPSVEVRRFFEVKDKEDGMPLNPSVFASLTSSLKIQTVQNQYEYDASYAAKEEGAYELTTIFEETGAASTDVSTGPRTDAYAFIETNRKTNVTKTYQYYRTSGNKVGKETINAHNQVAVEKIVDEDGLDYAWGSTPYWNFFAEAQYATSEDFVTFDKGNTYVYTGDFLQASYLCYSLFLSPFSPDDFYLLMQKDGTIDFYVNVDPTFDPSTKRSDKKYGQTLTGSFLERGTAEVSHLTPYPHEDFHDPLNEAIAKMGNLQCYKSHLTIDYSSSDEGDAEIFFTYNEDNVDQIVVQGGESTHTGIHKIDANNYFKYSVNSDQVVVRESDVAAYWHSPENNVKRYPTFDFVGEIFESLGNRVYQTRGDLGYITTYASYLPAAFSYCDYDEPVKITLSEDNYIAKLEVTSTYFDEKVTLVIEYSDFLSASTGLDFDHTITEIVVTGWNDDPEAKGLYRDMQKWFIDGVSLDSIIPFCQCPVGWSGYVGRIQSDLGFEYFDTKSFVFADGSIDQEKMNQFIADYQEACEKAGYVATGEKEPQTGGIIYRNDKGYEISIAQKVNPWNGYATSYCRVGFRAPKEITQYVE
ncbi:MAG: hypothetical protein SOV58_04350 [Candidatus Enteromonas sp.]|nr:hypothetical protein [Candidatus Enteromonas sp.]